MKNIILFTCLSLLLFTITVGQNIIHTLGQAEYVYYVNNGNLVAINEEGLSVYDSDYKKIADQPFPETVKNLLDSKYLASEDVLLIKLKVKVGANKNGGPIFEDINQKYDYMKNSLLAIENIKWEETNDFSILNKSSLKVTNGFSISPDGLNVCINTNDGNVVVLKTNASIASEKNLTTDNTKNVVYTIAGNLICFSDHFLIIYDSNYNIITKGYFPPNTHQFLDYKSDLKGVLVKLIVFTGDNKGALEKKIMQYNLDDNSLIPANEAMWDELNQPFIIDKSVLMAKSIKDFVFSPNGSEICVLKEDGIIEIWSTNTIDQSMPKISMPGILPSPSTSDLINNLTTTETEIYKMKQSLINMELDLKSYLFEPKGEYETTDEYETRLKSGKDYFKEIITYYTNLQKAENIFDTNTKNSQDAFDAKIKREQDAFVEKIEREQDAFEKQTLSTRKRFQDSIAVEDKKRTKILLYDKIKNSYQEYLTVISSIGEYNADKETFPIVIDTKNFIIGIPRSIAPDFKLNYEKYKVVGSSQLKESGQEERLLGYKIVSNTGEVYRVGVQNQPLYVDDNDMDKLLRETIVDITKPVAAPLTRSAAEVRVSSGIVETIRSKEYYALLIGVNNYASQTIVSLENPVNDAKKLNAILTEKYGFKKENVTFLQDPTRADIIESFDALSSKITEEDNLLVFYAGHGIWDETLSQGFWLPSDSKSTSKVAWLSNSTIRDYIGGIKSKHSLLIADACFSGGIFKTREVFVDDAVGYAQLYKLPSRKAMTSGNMKPVQDQSVFMKYFLDRLTENEEPLISAEQLFMSIKIPVANNSLNGQVPQFGDIMNAGDEGGDFIFAIKN